MNNLLNQNSVTNYWWDCPSCGATKISSILHKDGLFQDEGEIVGARLHCPHCAYVMRGTENTYVDETIYEVPAEWVDRLQTLRWQCQQCGGLNEKPSDKELGNLTVDDLYCKHCDTWQCDIPGAPGYDPEARLRREKRAVERKDRFENPITPVELIEDRDKFEQTYGHKPSSSDYQDIDPSTQFPANAVPNPFKSLLVNRNQVLVTTAVVGVISLTGLAAHDGLRTREVKATISDPIAVITVEIQEYEIEQFEGWSPNRSAPDFRLLSQEQRQNGTRQVPDGVETYFEMERYIARHETETYTDTVSERVQSGTRQDCQSVKRGVTSVQECRTVPTYTTQTRPVQRTRQVPVYDTRQVQKTRQRYRTEPVYDTWYRWENGVWERETVLRGESNTFQLQYPDDSSYHGDSEYRVLTPVKNCSVLLTNPEVIEEPVRHSIDCSQFQTLEDGQSGLVIYSKWGGIKSMSIPK